MIEVLVSSILVASLMGSLLWVIDYSTLVWAQIHQKNVLINEGVAVLDALESDLLVAKAVTQPAVGGDDVMLKFQGTVFAQNDTSKHATANFVYQLNAGVVGRSFENYVVTDNTGVTSISPGVYSDATLSKVPEMWYRYDLTRHVATFDVNRVATNRFDITIMLQSSIAQTAQTRENNVLQMTLTRTVIAPNL